MKKILVRLVGFAGFCVIASCSEPTSTLDLQGDFYLSQVDSRPLPALIWTSADERFLVTAESLSFDGHGTVTRTTAERFENTHTGAVRSELITRTAQYKVTNSSLEIGSFTPCPADAICVGNDIGSFSKEQISLTVHLSGKPQDFVYLPFVACHQICLDDA
jgi:hypothetical protein